MRKLFIYSLIYFAVSFTLEAQITLPKNDTLQQKLQVLSPLGELQRDISQLLDNPDFFNANIGISVISLETGETLFKYNDTKNFIPASTQKVLTSSAALHYLSKDYRYTTSVYIDGTLKPNGEFLGNVIIRGSGDPTMSLSFMEDPIEIFNSWANTLDSIGIKSIRGNIIGDDSFFDDVYYARGWAWDDISFPYSAQTNGLNIFDNKVNITIEPNDSINLYSKISIYPENDYVSIFNNIKTIPDNQFADVYHKRELQSNIIELYGGIKISQKKNKNTLAVTVDNPTLFFLNLFKLALEKNNIRFRGALLDIDDWNERINYSELHPIAEHISPNLIDIIKNLNKTSNNLIAEVLLKTIAKEQTGVGSFDRGIELLNKYSTKLGIAPENITIVDGSGLSRQNLFSPRYQTQLLASIFRSSQKDLIISSLAEPGKEGTLQNRMTNSLAEKNIKAKTGTMTGVSTLCGFASTKDKETLAFSIMISNYTVALSLAHNLQDLICMRLAGFSRKRR